MNEGYDLVYYRKEDGKTVYVKRFCPGQYGVYDPDTFEKFRISARKLKELYKSGKKKIGFSKGKFFNS